MNKRILAETDPDLAQPGAALERAARDARRLADQTNTASECSSMERYETCAKLEREAQVAPTSTNRVSLLHAEITLQRQR